MKRLIPALMLLLALPVPADVVIRARDGTVYRVPVNPQDVVSIEMVPGSGVPPGPSLAPPSAADIGVPWVVNSNNNIFRGDGRALQPLSGLAQDIGVGADGSAWVIGTNVVPGGFGIWRLAGNNWVPVDGGAVRITVDARGEPWVVANDGRILHRRANAWRELPGRATDIGAGANGEVWIIGMDSVPGGFGVYRWGGNDWARVDGAAVRIAVGPDGAPWVVNAEGRIYRRQGGTWAELPGRARDIAVSAGGTAWIVGTEPVPGGNAILHWNGASWVRVEGGAVGIAAR